MEEAANEAGASSLEDSLEDRLIWQEKVDRVLEAIESLPEIDRALMEDFYLEDVPYRTLQKRYYLSKAAVRMRLFKAREKVRERLKELFSGAVAFPWRNITKILFMKGGLEAVKIGMQTKLIAGGVVFLLALGGIGTLFWRSHQLRQEIELSKSAARASVREISTISPASLLATNSPAADQTGSEPADEQDWEMSEEEVAEALAWMDTLEEYSETQDAEQSGSPDTEADEQKRAEDEAAQLGHEREVEAAREQVVNTIFAKADVLEWFRTHARSEKDPEVLERHQFARRNLGLRLITVDIPNYRRLTGDHAGMRRGGWIYELCIENGFTIGPDPYEAYNRNPEFFSRNRN